MAPTDCEHAWETRLRGGEPLSVRVCRSCGRPDWEDLREQVTALCATKLARTYVFIGGPWGGQEHALPAGLVPPADVRVPYPLTSNPYEPYRGGVAQLQRDVDHVVYTYRRVGHYGERVVRGFYAAQHISREEAQLRLRDCVFERWIVAAPDSKPED